MTTTRAATMPAAAPLPEDLTAVLKRMRLPYLRAAAVDRFLRTTPTSSSPRAPHYASPRPPPDAG